MLEKRKLIHFEVVFSITSRIRLFYLRFFDWICVMSVGIYFFFLDKYVCRYLLNLISPSVVLEIVL
jgi:hypothetical protein